LDSLREGCQVTSVPLLLRASDRPAERACLETIAALDETEKSSVTAGLSADQIASLNARARTVGNRIGWELRFEADEDPELAGLTAGVRHVFVVGPTRLADLAPDDILSVLDALLLGSRRILDDDVPRLV
jgi:hypothetical protein